MPPQKFMEWRYAPEDCNILFIEDKAPVMIGYIHGDEGPRVSINYWGNETYIGAWFLLTTKTHKASELNAFYDETLQAKKAEKLNLDSLVGIVKKHFENIKA